MIELVHRWTWYCCYFITDPIKPEIVVAAKEVEEYKPISITTDIGSSIHSLDENDITLRCPARGLPKPKITWFKQGLQLKNSGQSFSILKAKKSDSGNYTCIATNLVGSAFQTSEVFIEGEKALSVSLFEFRNLK